MKFTKMQGCGNDYVYVNGFEEHVPDAEKPALARRVSDRHFGIGSDGLIFINPSEKADFEMEMYNLDGTRGEMCGNGIRCVGKYVYDHGMTDRETITVETLAGIKELVMKAEDGKVREVRVDMGAPFLKPEEVPVSRKAALLSEGGPIVDQPIVCGGKEFRFTAVSMGNPHAVVFVSDVKPLDLVKIGPLFENHEFFPNRVNTEFIRVNGPKELEMRVWERGSGETMACGTGACASVVAAVLNRACRKDEDVTVHLLGGDLRICWDSARDTVFLTGPAETSFEGTIA